MGTPVRETEGICVLRTESVCASVAFFTLNSPYMLKKFQKNSESERACQAGFSKLSQLRSCIVTVRQIIYGCFHALEFHNKVFWALFC